MDNFNNGEQNILNNTSKAIDNVKRDVFRRPVESDIFRKSEDNGAFHRPLEDDLPSKGNEIVRKKTLEGGNGLYPPAKDSLIRPSSSEQPLVAANPNIYSRGDTSSQSGSGFIVVVLAVIAFIVLSIVLGYGLIAMFN